MTISQVNQGHPFFCENYFVQILTSSQKKKKGIYTAAKCPAPLPFLNFLDLSLLFVN